MLSVNMFACYCWIHCTRLKHVVWLITGLPRSWDPHSIPGAAMLQWSCRLARSAMAIFTYPSASIIALTYSNVMINCVIHAWTHPIRFSLFLWYTLLSLSAVVGGCFFLASGPSIYLFTAVMWICPAREALNRNSVDLSFVNWLYYIQR